MKITQKELKKFTAEDMPAEFSMNEARKIIEDMSNLGTVSFNFYCLEDSSADSYWNEARVEVNKDNRFYEVVYNCDVKLWDDMAQKDLIDIINDLEDDAQKTLCAFGGRVYIKD